MNEASPEPGSLGAAVRTWFQSGAAASCENDKRKKRPCTLDNIFVMNVFSDPGATRGLAFINYDPGFYRERTIVAGQFERKATGWAFVRKLDGVTGDQPENVAFTKDGVSFTTAAEMPTDPPGSPSGLQPYVVDLTTGAVKLAPRMTRRAWDGTELVGTPYLYDGSVVLVSEEMGEIRYKQPRRALRKLVEKGTLLFHGDFAKDGQIFGRAHLFKAACEPATFKVQGRSIGDIIILEGSMPSWMPHSCELDRASNAKETRTIFRFTKIRNIKDD